MLRSYARIVRALDADLEAGAGLSVRSYEVLVRLSRSPQESLRMSELAESVLLSPSGVTRLVDHLVNRGLVSRRKDPSDARSYLAELTKEGKSVHRKAKRVYERAIQEHFAAHLSEQQLNEVATALGVIVRAMPGKWNMPPES
jgi:DNA-binding MarR family transcriptional regulator